MREITIAELKEQSKESYQLIDIRDEGSTVYGMIPGAICIPIKQLMENLDGCVNRIKNNVKVVIYCQRGEKSRDIAESLEEMGLDCYSLAGGCNKIALGHHYDDVIETILMGMLHGGQIQTMMPKLHSTNFEGMELIRPLYLIREEDICKWRDYNKLHFLQCACHFTETCSTCHEDGTTSSKRLETKKLIAKLKVDNPFIESNIFKSVENVNLSTVIAYKKDGVKHHFLDEY